MDSEAMPPPRLGFPSPADLSSPAAPAAYSLVRSHSVSALFPTAAEPVRSFKRSVSAVLSQPPLSNNANGPTAVPLTPTSVTRPLDLEQLAREFIPGDCVPGQAHSYHKHPNLPVAAVLDHLGHIGVYRSPATLFTVTPPRPRQLVYETALQQPIVAFRWLPSERVYQTQSAPADQRQSITQLTRGPLCGPRNPYGPLAFVVVTAVGEVHFCYQFDGAFFTTTACPLAGAGVQDPTVDAIARASLAFTRRGQCIVATSRPESSFGSHTIQVHSLALEFAAFPPTVQARLLCHFSAMVAPSSDGSVPPLAVGNYVIEQLLVQTEAAVTTSLEATALISTLLFPRAPLDGPPLLQTWVLRPHTMDLPAVIQRQLTPDQASQCAAHLQCDVVQMLAQQPMMGNGGALALAPVAGWSASRTYLGVVTRYGQLRVYDPISLQEEGLFSTRVPIENIAVAKPFEAVFLSTNALMVYGLTPTGDVYSLPVIAWDTVPVDHYSTVLTQVACALAEAVLNRAPCLDVVGFSRAIPAALDHMHCLLDGVTTVASARVLATLNNPRLTPGQADALTVKHLIKTLMPLYRDMAGYDTSYSMLFSMAQIMALWDNLATYFDLPEVLSEMATDRWATPAFLRDLPFTLPTLRWVLVLVVNLVRDGHLYFSAVQVGNGIHPLCPLTAPVKQLSASSDASLAVATPTRFACLFVTLCRKTLRQLLALVTLFVQRGEAVVKQRAPPGTLPHFQAFLQFVQSDLPLSLDAIIRFIDQVEAQFEIPPNGSPSVLHHPLVQGHWLATGRAYWRRGLLMPIFHSLDLAPISTALTHCRQSLLELLKDPLITKKVLFYPTQWLDLGTITHTRHLRPPTSSQTVAGQCPAIVHTVLPHRFGPALDPHVRPLNHLDTGGTSAVGESHEQLVSTATGSHPLVELALGPAGWLDVVRKASLPPAALLASQSQPVGQCLYCHRLTLFLSAAGNEPSTSATSDPTSMLLPSWLLRSESGCSCGGPWGNPLLPIVQ
ncbi:hypothetical protein H4R34_003925 [Dimargaris verticillata]|uniref:Mediator of RNA polymerase II transcription subunit 16 n=1 Tax=Dimargaris verticillata TaxID=2761393 RepID=A0A9W8AZX8_9FUNG|nr:hypothetical protein H4R34_003925 [Dimargaris verticillata]